MNKTLLIFIIVLILAVGAFFMFFDKSDAPILEDTGTVPTGQTENPTVGGVSIEAGAQMETGTLGEATAKNITITYNGTGYLPKTVTVKKGDSVTFVNESDGGMSTASDPHPSHSIYPEFDQYKSSQRGQKSYTFVFDKVGTWGYHNHLNSSAVGTVVVE